MPALGITRIADLTGLDTLGVPVWSAIRPNGRSLSTSQGKGLSDQHAIASALMESIETWHAEHVALPRRRATFRTLGKGLGRLPRAGRACPDPDRVIDWVEGWDLAAGAPAWVPLEAVTLDTVFPPGYAPVFDVSSNGLASGNHPAEAIVHAVCEVIERDAEARWRAARGDRRVDLETIPGAAGALVARLGRAGVHVTVWDLTSDLGVPVHGCAILEDPREPSWRSLGLYQGFGCHLDPEVSVIRAVTEAVQTRVTYIAGSRDDFFPGDYARATDQELLAGIWDQLTAAPRDGWVDLAAAPRLAGDTFEADLAVLLERLAGHRVIAVDLSRRAHGIPVVKVLIPGRATRVELMG
jgi:ribosomal protein S12 methylthiotransferase accessory factor